MPKDYGRQPIVSTRCVCGGWLHAQELTDAAIRHAVVTHNATGRHREWVALGGFDFDPELMLRRTA